MTRKYSKSSQEEVKKEIRSYKKGKARSGRGGKRKVKSRQQAIAIGLSKARKKGAKVPKKGKNTGKKGKSPKSKSRRSKSRKTQK